MVLEGHREGMSSVARSGFVGTLFATCAYGEHQRITTLTDLPQNLRAHVSQKLTSGMQTSHIPYLTGAQGGLGGVGARKNSPHNIPKA